MSDPTVSQCVEEFLAIVQRLVGAMAARWPADARVASIRRRVRTAIDLAPLEVVDKVGEELWPYRTELQKLDTDPAAVEAFFMRAEIVKAGADAEPDGNANLAEHLVGRIREVVGTLAAAEKEAYARDVADLFYIYVDYKAALEADAAARGRR